MGLHFFTSVVANYLPKARVLCESLRKFHPEATIHVVLCDQVPTSFSVESEPFDYLLTLEDLPVPNLTSWLFQHDLVELSTAVKGFALQSLLAREDCDRVIYLDPDVVLLAPLWGLLANFQRASVLLTTHQSEPEDSYGKVRENELLTLQHGVFNLGFLGIKKSVTGCRFAQWWTDRLRDFCFDDIPIGLFVDQRWPDLVPSFFPDHKILRDSVYNVAGWNLTQRQIEGSLEQGFTVDGKPLVFCHFSGIDTGRDLDMLQRYGNGMPAYYELRQWYLESCERHGQAIYESVPWAYGFFADGEPILKSQRRQYRHNPDLQSRFPDPFNCFPAQLAPVPQGIEEPEIKVEPYRIFLIVAPADEQYFDETLTALKKNSIAWNQITLVARAARGDVQSIVLDATRYDDFVAHVFQNFLDKDIILIRAGAFPPPQWDLRLAWACARELSALTVSPLDRRFLDDAALFSQTEPDEFDILCYFYRHGDELETPYFNPDCVYIRSSGLRDLARNRNELRLSNLLDDTARKRWQHLQATHICLSFRCARSSATSSTSSFSERTFFPQLRNRLLNHADDHGAYVPRRVTSALTAATLHVSHNWGGGVEQWVRSFAEADVNHEQLVLKSIGPNGMFGGELALFRYGRNGLEWLQTWTLSPGVRATAVAHAGYRKILSEIAEKFRVGRIIISSLIGHSLDCLRTKLPTVFICHDYYPFCSAINLTFGETCSSCEPPRLAACLEENPLNQNFPNVAKSEWLVLRDEFLSCLKRNGVELVAPSPSVRDNYIRLIPELAGAFRVIAHGLRPFSCQKANGNGSRHGLLRVLLLGSLNPHKGVFLLEAMLNELLSFADITLAGSLDIASRFSGHPKIHVISRYKQEELPNLVADIQPDVGLFLSVWPETFSYTLHEMQSLCVPPVATRVGGYADAIKEGATGFLCEPEPLSLLHRLRYLANHRTELETVRLNLGRLKRRSVDDMVGDYAALTPDPYLPTRYFAGPHAPEELSGQALQLYWCKPDAAFTEANSFSFAPFHLKSQTARLYIPALNQPIGKLRFDPGSEPGLIEIDRMMLCDKTGSVLWSSSDCRSLLQSAPHAKVFALSSSALCVTGNDPNIALPVPPEQLTRLSKAGGYLEVGFAWRTLASEAGSIFEDLLDETARTRVQLVQLEKTEDTLEQQIKQCQEEFEKARQHNENVMAAYNSVIDSQSWRLTKPLRSAIQLGRKLTGRG